MFDQRNLYGCATDLGLGGRKCCRVGDALQPFASVWVRRRKLPSTQVLFIALPAPSCDFTWPDIPPRPPRCGREATGPPTPRSTRRGVASTADPREPRRPLVGRRSNGPQTVAPSLDARDRAPGWHRVPSWNTLDGPKAPFRMLLGARTSFARLQRAIICTIEVDSRQPAGTRYGRRAEAVGRQANHQGKTVRNRYAHRRRKAIGW